MDCGYTVFVREGWGVGEEMLRWWGGSGDEIQDQEEDAGIKKHLLGCELEVQEGEMRFRLHTNDRIDIDRMRTHNYTGDLANLFYIRPC